MTELIRSLDGLHELRSTWDSISTPWPSPMQGHEWVRTCAEVFGIDRDLEIVVEGTPPAAAIAPLVRSKGDGVRLEFVGASKLHEPMDLVYSDDSATTMALARTLARLRVPLRFPRLLADSPVLAALRSAYRRRGVVISRPAMGSPWIPLDATWSVPERHLSRHRRQGLHRARRIAEAMGTVSVEILSPTPADVGRLMDEAYAVEAEGWKGRDGSALVHNASLGEFYRRYATAACEKGILRLGFLRIGGQVAAMQIAAEIGRRFWLLKIGYSEAFSRCSPGVLLLAETIRYAADSGLRSYEFLGAEEPWIEAWTSHVRPCVSLWSYPVGARGGMALVNDAVASIRRRVEAVS